MNEKLKLKLSLLPNQPGVYLMKDSKEEIIYVGKAKSLKNRIKSYFNSFYSHDVKTQELVSNIYVFDYIITDTEIEALVLESILIQRHQPKFNIRIPDNKHFLYISIDESDPFPKLESAYKIERDQKIYFGPFPNSYAVRNLIDVLSKVFKLRTCNKDFTKSNLGRACLNYHIGLCQGPCINEVSRDEYKKQLQKAIDYLSGEEDKVVKELKEEMHQAASNLNFEKAAHTRDVIDSLTGVLNKQKIVSGKRGNMDIISIARGVEDVCVLVLFMRDGHIIGKDANMMINSDNRKSKEILSAFIEQYYSHEDSFIPKEIIVDGEVENHELIEQWLTNKKGYRVYVQVPKRGDKKKLALMARKNALLNVEEQWKKRGAKDDTRQETLEELSHFLKLPKTPKRIECYDISNIQGTNSVGSMVVFVDGKAKKSHYRRFRIKTVDGPDDFASMKEVLSRRIARLNSDDVSFKNEPDLIIIDGGLGQLSSVEGIIKKLDTTSISIISLAKREELVYRPGSNKPIRLPNNSRSLYLIQRIRDEAHRFAIEYHKRLRNKHAKQSVLSEIDGIGKVRQKNLLIEFKSLKAIKEASVSELAKVKSMNKKTAKAVYDYFNKGK
ncbi:MAG: excinuclease ABC subunit UvrC [Clostridia bacterium]